MYAKVSDVQLYLRINLGPPVWGGAAISRMAFPVRARPPRQHYFARVRPQHARIINGCQRPVLSYCHATANPKPWDARSAKHLMILLQTRFCHFSENRESLRKTCRNLKTRDILFIWDSESSLPPSLPAPPPSVYPAVTRSPRRAVVFLQLTRLFYPPDLRDHLCRRING